MCTDDRFDWILKKLLVWFSFALVGDFQIVKVFQMVNWGPVDASHLQIPEEGLRLVVS